MPRDPFLIPNHHLIAKVSDFDIKIYCKNATNIYKLKNYIYHMVR